MNIVSHLSVGRDHAITYANLADWLHVSRRDIEQAIEDARRSGILICTGSAGAWLPESPQEALDNAERLRRRYVSQAVTARAQRRAARAWARKQAHPEPDPEPVYQALTLWRGAA